MNEDEQRKLFEAWAAKYTLLDRVTGIGNQSYASAFAELSWQAWLESVRKNSDACEI